MLVLKDHGNSYLILVAVINDDDVDEAFMSAPLRLNWAAFMTLRDMNRFIDVTGSNVKQSILSQKKRR